MALDREIERVRKDTEHWRALVLQLLRREDDLAPRHVTLLESLAEKRRWLGELSYRQAEWLLDIRDDIQNISEFRGWNVRRLIKCCYEGRFDFDEDDEAWVTEIHDSGRTSVRKYEARRLRALAQALGDVND